MNQPYLYSFMSANAELFLHALHEQPPLTKGVENGDGGLVGGPFTTQILLDDHHKQMVNNLINKDQI